MGHSKKEKKSKKHDSSKVNYVYYFGGKKADGTAEMKSLLGGKGANLAEMVNMVCLYLRDLQLQPKFVLITTKTVTNIQNLLSLKYKKQLQK